MELSAEAVEVLQAGRRLVMASWCQKSFKDDNGAVCAYGALSLSGCNELVPIHDALYALEDELGLTHASEACVAAIVRWNDAPERTHADVVALFDRVLTKAAAREVVKS